ncbi:GNAT family N-acetyltransferase [Pseudoclavibacter terrae]|uniref:GNAT family N-acetyltransferase n=1 Tax=Pseudoclavibacter terrae TaxID=1530195 RepID=A0A7J5B6Y2_9MICO|nr:GNAT family N-acetyltransferase [Pseudoclavibacter terrae]
MSIRRAVPADVQDLLGIWRRSVEATHAFLSAADVDAIALDVESYLPRMSDLRVAERGGRLVGFVALEGDVIEMLFVDADAQGTGVGSTLLDAVLAGRALTRVDVNEQNSAGRAFYARRGFVEVGRSETDGEGRPFPILHLTAQAAATPRYRP